MPTRRSLLLAASAVFVSICGSATARPRDRGGYRVLRARYGTEARNVDVTEQLRRLARRDRRIQVSNELFGVDPAYGETKTLRIYTRAADGGARVFEYREKEFVDGSLFRDRSEGRWGRGPASHEEWDDGPQLVVLSASYGRGSRTRDVTRRLRGMVRGGHLDLTVDNQSLGSDPAPGRRKHLEVVYVIDGARRRARVMEEDRLSLP